MSKGILSAYLEEDAINEIEKIAKEKKTNKTTVARWAIMEYLDPKLSAISIAALTQVAQDQGLNDLDEAVMYLVRKGE